MEHTILSKIFMVGSSWGLKFPWPNVFCIGETGFHRRKSFFMVSSISVPAHMPREEDVRWGVGSDRRNLSWSQGHVRPWARAFAKVIFLNPPDKQRDSGFFLPILHTDKWSPERLTDQSHIAKRAGSKACPHFTSEALMKVIQFLYGSSKEWWPRIP